MDKNQEIIERLRKEYGNTESALHYENPYELLVATILAAQCTDVRVNIVTTSSSGILRPKSLPGPTLPRWRVISKHADFIKIRPRTLLHVRSVS